jgi:hypothetical protein
MQPNKIARRLRPTHTARPPVPRLSIQYHVNTSFAKRTGRGKRRGAAFGRRSRPSVTFPVGGVAFVSGRLRPAGIVHMNVRYNIVRIQPNPPCRTGENHSGSVCQLASCSFKSPSLTVRRVSGVLCPPTHERECQQQHRIERQQGRASNGWTGDTVSAMGWCPGHEVYT